jgi:hypothetical protein
MLPYAALAVTSLLLYCATADAQWDTVTGHIRPTPGVPIFDPAPWNAAFKVMYRNVPLNDPVQLGNPRYKTTPRTVASTPLQCSSTGFDTTPVYQVKLVSCCTPGYMQRWLLYNRYICRQHVCILMLQHMLAQSGCAVIMTATWCGPQQCL